MLEAGSGHVRLQATGMVNEVATAYMGDIGQIFQAKATVVQMSSANLRRGMGLLGCEKGREEEQRVIHWLALRMPWLLG